jgi:hypothetical protein
MNNNFLYAYFKHVSPAGQAIMWVDPTLRKLCMSVCQGFFISAYMTRSVIHMQKPPLASYPALRAFHTNTQQG